LKIVLTIIGLLAVSTTAATAYDCSPETYKSARAKVGLAFATGRLAVNPTDKNANVLISDQYWGTMPLPEKITFADAMVCAVAGVGKAMRSFQFRSLTTGKPVGDWNMGTLTLP
jgi:hypothetical protein